MVCFHNTEIITQIVLLAGEMSSNTLQRPLGGRILSEANHVSWEKDGKR